MLTIDPNKIGEISENAIRYWSRILCHLFPMALYQHICPGCTDKKE